MTDIEIPYENERDWRYRCFEILPGALSWCLLALPLVLAFINVTLATFFVLAYILMWLARSVGVDIRALQAYHQMDIHAKLDWQTMLNDLESGQVSPLSNTKVARWHTHNVVNLQTQPPQTPPSELIHVAMIAAYNEGIEVLEPTVQALLASEYDMKQVILVLAYEGRDGAKSEKAALELLEKYGSAFKHAFATKHPLTPHEVRGKGGNITYAARILEKYLKEQRIEPRKVIVTTLDSDNRPHKKYFGALSYTYTVCPDPLRTSFQPIVMYTNNIWDAPAPMRVLATGNFFWNIMQQLRPHMLRNFSSHAQSMEALIETNFWSVRTVVEDGHQFWRTYFRFDGKHEVYPIYLPIYQDAVFARTYLRSLKAQFIQLRRWTWGASDIAYIVNEGFLKPNKVPRRDLIIKLLRITENHVTWATMPLLLAFAAFVPALLHPQSYAANILPLTVSRIETIALIGVLSMLFISLKTLPPKPARYKRRHSIFMVLQWVYLPFIALIYPSMAALNSQTRLMFGWYLGNFDVTEKAVAKDEPVPQAHEDM